jgi:hypothetical protein
MLRILIVSCALLGTGAAAAASDAQPVEIVSAEFGLFDDRNPRELVFEPGAVVPHRVGQRYGWIIGVRTAKRSVSVSEEYLLPSAAPTLAAPAASSAEVWTIPQGRRNQVSQRQLVPVDGRIYGEWAIGPEEPAGHRHLQVLVEGQVAASFEFDVKRPD